ncbi:hypothetical protein [Arthrobacter sp. IK3]|uniref:hypothetical protein n=1 Tax=Arthrobacter sp. IK3 TaxID=3448169 RepID=UPI003EE0183F
MARNDQTEATKVHISTRLLDGGIPDSEADNALEVLGALDPDDTGADYPHPELQPEEDYELPPMSRSWINTHR